MCVSFYENVNFIHFEYIHMSLTKAHLGFPGCPPPGIAQQLQGLAHLWASAAEDVRHCSLTVSSSSSQPLPSQPPHSCPVTPQLTAPNSSP